MRILSIDPSGSFKEGKGTSGWIILNEWSIETFGQIKAKDFDNRYDYWAKHYGLVLEQEPDEVVAEEFILYAKTSSAQINSEMETSKLLGYLEMSCHQSGFNMHKQRAVDAKMRYTDKILLKKGYITKKGNRYYINGVNVSGHIIDALRHALYFQLKKTMEEMKNDRN